MGDGDRVAPAVPVAQVVGGLDMRIAEFERTNRRRRALGFAILGMCTILAGAAVIAMAVFYEEPNEHVEELPKRVRLVVYGVIGVLIGIGLAITAYRIARRKIVDG